MLAKVEKKKIELLDILKIDEEVHLDELEEFLWYAEEQIALVDEEKSLIWDEIDELCMQQPYQSREEYPEDIRSQINDFDECSVVFLSYSYAYKELFTFLKRIEDDPERVIAWERKEDTEVWQFTRSS